MRSGSQDSAGFLHCQYTASLDLYTFSEIFRSAIIGNYNCEKGLLQWKSYINSLDKSSMAVPK